MRKALVPITLLLVVCLIGGMSLPRSESTIDGTKTKQVFLLSGMMAPEESLYPLVHYLRTNQSDYGVAAIPLGLSVADFDTIVDSAATHIEKQLPQERAPRTIVLFGHSHGGRVANALALKLKERYPATEIIVVTAGTPMVKRPDYLPWYMEGLFQMSSAYRSWPAVEQASSSVVAKEIGFYSTGDKVVIPEYAKAGYAGQLIELDGPSHHDLVMPGTIGPHLLDLLRAEPGV